MSFHTAKKQNELQLLKHMDASHRQNVGQKKPDTKKDMLYDSIYTMSVAVNLMCHLD